MSMSELNDKRELNPALLRKMEVRIYGYEHENHKTKRLTDSEMVQKYGKLSRRSFDRRTSNDYQIYHD